MPPPLHSEQLNAIARSINRGLSVGEAFVPSTVKAVASGRQLPIRAMTVEQRAIGITGMLWHIIPKYGGRNEVSDETVDEAVELIVNHFSFLGVDELLEAYRLWQAGAFKAEGMYYGDFTIAQLGSVLRGYTNHRRTVSQAIAMEEIAIVKAEENEARQELNAKRYEEDLENFFNYIHDFWVGKATGPEIGSEEDVPAHWFGMATNLDLLHWENQSDKGPFWTRAKRLARRSIARQLTGDNKVAAAFVRKNRKDVQKARATIYGHRVVVFERLLFGPQFIDGHQDIFQSWQDVPAFLYAVCMRNRILVPDPEAGRVIRAEAKRVVYADDPPKTRKECRKYRAAVLTVYGKMYVWHKLFGNC